MREEKNPPYFPKGRAIKDACQDQERILRIISGRYVGKTRHCQYVFEDTLKMGSHAEEAADST